MIPIPGSTIVVINPDHEDAPAGKIVIPLLPDTNAWGYGWHPSTQSVLRGMETALDLTGKTVADVGSASGLLAITAHLLGAAKVYAVEMQEPRAVVCRRNCALTSADIEVLEQRGLDRDVDIVVANLGDTASTVDALKHATQGFLVTIDERDGLFFKQTMEAAGFTIEQVDRFSNVGPKPEPIPANYISRLYHGSR